MLDVDQNYGTPDTPKPFPTFKDYVAQDVQNVIFNPNEFAEERYIDDKSVQTIYLSIKMKKKYCFFLTNPEESCAAQSSSLMRRR